MPRPIQALLAALALAAIVVPTAAARDYVPGELLVRWKPATRQATRMEALRPLGATRLQAFRVPGLERVRVDGMAVEEAVVRLSLDARVEYAEPNYLWSIDRRPNDERYDELYGLRNYGQTGGIAGADIRAEAAWDHFTGDPTMLIGNLDTGCQYDHPDLATNIWTNPGEIPGNEVDDDGNGYVDDIHGYDFLNHDGDPRDDNGHGTHTTGTIAAIGNNGIGVTGVLWRAKVVVLKFLGSNGNGPTSAAVEALEYATRLGVRLTNNSWGGPVYSRAVEDAIAEVGAVGQLFVTSAGNARSDIDAHPQYPAALADDCILSVAATDQSDQLTSFSNYGLTSVDIAAPGNDILSTGINDSYRVLSGTSMSAPLVTGACAFLMGRFPSMTASEVKSRILRLADPLPGLAGRCVSGGRLNLALASADPDSLAPGAVGDLATTLAGSNSMDLAWTATGDDGATGTASRYELRVGTEPLTPANFAGARLVPAPVPRASGGRESARVRGLTTGTTYWFGVIVRDEFGNPGPLSNVASAATTGPPRLVLTPQMVTASANTGVTLVREVELVNDSPGTLEWESPAPELDFGGAQQMWPAEERAKGDDGPLREPQTASAGGPDAFGYRWADSDEENGPAFQWVDIATPANAIALTGDEAVSAARPIGFSFPLYGRRFTNLRVCTNGYLQFGNEGPAFVNTGLPANAGPRNMIAAFWDDLHLGSGSDRAYVRNDGTRCIVTWQGVTRYNDAQSVMTFQCILYPSGEIRFQYRSMAGNTSAATIGIQDSTRTAGLTVAFNQEYVHDDLAVRIVPLRQWLAVEPPAGFIPAHGRQVLQLRMDASGLASATYRGRVRLLTNDPAAPDTGVAVELAVQGAPHLVFSPATLDFGAHFTGARDTLAVTVANDGVDPLLVTAVSTDQPDFTVPAESFKLLPGEATALPVVFSPAAVAERQATLTLTCNDPARPLATLPLRGSGSAAPEIETPATELAAATTSALDDEAERQVRLLVLRNSGGAPLEWNAVAYQGLIGSDPALAADAAAKLPPIAQVKGATGPGVGAHGDGGPDAFGYRWQDSDAVDGPDFAWEEIAGIGRRLFGGADDSVTTVPLPFPFSFYGHTYTHVNVCTNGFLSFTSRDSSLVNTDLPNAAPGVPRALVAPFWTDLDLRPARGAGRVYAHHDGSKFIVEWKDAVHFSGASPYSFQVFLWPSGAIEFQYQALGALLDRATVGIQDETGTVGLRVAYDVRYAHPGLRVRFSFQEDWLRLDRTSGVTPPGGSDTLRVTFDARDHREGDYAGEVRVTSNDVEQPLLAVPCAMHVGLRTEAADALPGALGALSLSPVVRFLLTPPAAGSVRATSLALDGQRVVPVGEPVLETDGRLSVALRGVDLLRLLPDGERTVTLSGEYEQGGWFAAPATLNVAAPDMVGGPIPAFGSAMPPRYFRGNEAVSLAWIPPDGEPDGYSVAYSSDGGLRWTDIGSTDRPQFHFLPPDTTTGAMLEVVARRGDSVIGTWLSAPFTVDLEVVGVPPARVPARFALRQAGATPARGRVPLRLELPRAQEARVEVFDVRGARVRTLHAGWLAAGEHPVDWDGVQDSGGNAAAGIYLVRASGPTGSAVVRIALLR